MSTAAKCAACTYCATVTPPPLTCNPCVPCVGSPLVCGTNIPVAVLLANTACLALMSLRTVGVLNATTGPLEPAFFTFFSCGDPGPVPEVSPVLVNGDALYSWVDPLTPNLLRLGTVPPSGSSPDLVQAVNWTADPALSTCSDLVLTAVQAESSAVQQMQSIVKGDSAFNLFAGDIVIVLDITQGWGTVGAALLMPAVFRVLESA